MGRLRVPLVVRLRSYEVNERGCWLWTGSVVPSGYGRLKIGHNELVFRAHRASWEHHRSPIPKGRQVLHSCEGLYARGDITSRRCINPDHLYLGGPRDNVADRVRLGRGADRRGERCPTAKLTVAAVRTLRVIRASGFGTYRELAEMFGVRPVTAQDICARRRWKEAA